MKKLRNSSVDIGDKQLGGAFFQTTYRAFNGPKNIKDAQPLAQNTNKSFTSSVSLGGSNNEFQAMTSTGSAFVAY